MSVPVCCVCLSVCLSANISLEPPVQTSPNFLCARTVARPWLSPPVVAFRDVIYFRLLDDAMFADNGHEQATRKDNVTQHVAARIGTAAYTQTDPPEGSTGPGAEYDIYDCLVTDALAVMQWLWRYTRAREVK